MMSNRYSAHAIASRLLLFALTLSSSINLSAAPNRTDLPPPKTPAEMAQREAVQRRQLLLSADQAVLDGQRLLGSHDYDQAADRFQFALDASTSGGATADLYARANAGLATAKAGQARAAAADTKFAVAADLLEQSIRLMPDDRDYRIQLEELKDQQRAYEQQVRDPEGTVHNPAVTEEFRSRVAAAQKLLFEGDRYFETGQLDAAETTYSKILIIDPYNKAARLKMQHIEAVKFKAANARHREYEKEAFEQVNQAWSEAISPDLLVTNQPIIKKSGPSNRAIISNKLQSIILPQVNFDKLDIVQVVSFLTEQSKELDPEKKGINFVLKLNPPPASAPAPGTTTPGAVPPPAAAPTAPGAPAAAPDAGEEIRRPVSITLNNVPLSEILSYIQIQTKLTYTVEDSAVYIHPSVDVGESLSIRTFLVPPNFFQNSDLQATNQGDSVGGFATVTSLSLNVVKELTNRGIQFPDGAAAYFFTGDSKLVVRNTAEQLDIISRLLDQSNLETPEVEMEAKIAEFTEDALKELSFNYELGYGSALIPSLLGAPIGVPNGGMTLETGLRTANYRAGGTADPNAGLNANGIDQLITQNAAAPTGTPGLSTGINPITGATIAPNSPNTFTIGAIIDRTGFAAIINAINNNKGVSLLSAPNVTTLSGDLAKIDIVRSFPYPSTFAKPQLSNANYNYSNGNILTTGLELAIPPTPSNFSNQDLGVSLYIKPTVSNQQIDLDIQEAQDIEFDGFINYGNGIVSSSVENKVVTLTPGTINQPVFNLRSIATRLQLLDGETAVLGGLIREDTQEINDKIPVLGDLPLLGRLFQSKITERQKRNLIIFVTARLIKSNGKPVYTKMLEAEPETATLPEPPPLDNGLALPAGNTEPGS